VALICSGANISPAQLAEALAAPARKTADG
jgi:hypothetical protein